MNHKQLDTNKFAVEAGLSDGFISSATRNNTELSSNIIEKILLTYQDLNPEWFICGVGEMLKPEYQIIIKNSYSNNGGTNNINGNIGGNVTISQSEFSNMLELQKGFQEIQKELTDLLKISQKQLSDAMQQVNSLFELLKRE